MAKAHGEIWPVDQLGRVVNAAKRSRLTPLTRRVSRAVADAYRTRFGDNLHSVYLTGPTARGRPGPVEALGVLRMTAACAGGPARLEEAAGAIRARWPSAGRPSLALLDWRDVFPEDDAFSHLRFRIGVNSLCLAGRDISKRLAPQRLSVAAANAWIVTARDRIADAERRVDLAAREEDLREWSRSIARELLAIGFALVMHHESVYTEDPDLQREFIRINHPSQEGDLNHAFRLADEATDEPSELLHLLSGYGRWLVIECDRWLDQHNPHRLSALPA